MEPKKTGRTRVVPGKVVADGLAGPGSGVLEVACWTPGKGESSGGMELRLGNYNHANEGRGDGYEELFVRYYIKFDGSYRGVANHGANLGGRDVSRPGSAWAGQAAIRDIASRGYFYSGLQPYGKNDSRELEMGFYSYHLDKHDQWGDEYPVQKHVPIRVGQWHCVERHLKLNSVTAAGEANTDGLEELWVDGQLSIQKAVRFRRTQKLRITFFSLGTYYHGLPKDYDAAHPITVYFDNLVIARKYIGPIAGKAAAPTEGAALVLVEGSPPGWLRRKESWMLGDLRCFYDSQDLGAVVPGVKKPGHVVPRSRPKVALPGGVDHLMGGSCWGEEECLLYIYSPGSKLRAAYEFISRNCPQILRNEASDPTWSFRAAKD